MTAGSGFQVGHDAPRFYESHVGLFMAPFVERLVQDAVVPGASVLDVACGTGLATRAAAEVAGPDGRVIGSDINPGMLAHARSISEGSGANIRWFEASALDLPFEDEEFDAVICQQGLQFFPDATAGLREMSRVTRSGGVLGITTWAPPETSPFLTLELEMIIRHGRATPGVWSTTEEGLTQWFEEAGLSAVSIELIQVDVDLPDLATYVPGHLRALPWSAGFFALPHEVQTKAIAELDDEMAEYRSGEGMRVPFSSYIAVARL